MKVELNQNQTSSIQGSGKGKEKKTKDIFELLFSQNLKETKEVSKKSTLKEEAVSFSAKKLISLESEIGDSQSKKVFKDLINQMLKEGKISLKSDTQNFDLKDISKLREFLSNTNTNVKLDISLKDYKTLIEKLNKDFMDKGEPHFLIDEKRKSIVSGHLKKVEHTNENLVTQKNEDIRKHTGKEVNVKDSEILVSNPNKEKNVGEKPHLSKDGNVHINENSDASIKKSKEKNDSYTETPLKTENTNRKLESEAINEEINIKDEMNGFSLISKGHNLSSEQEVKHKHNELNKANAVTTVESEETDIFAELKKHRLDMDSTEPKLISELKPENNHWQVATEKKSQMKLDNWIESFKHEIDKLADFRIENKQKVSMLLKEQDEQLRIIVEKRESYILIEAKVTDKMTDNLNVILSEIQNEMKDKGIEVRVDIKNDQDEKKENNDAEQEKQNEEQQHQGGNKNGRQRNQSAK
ncbi:hypothetical protein [Priestia aryabhattai]